MSGKKRKAYFQNQGKKPKKTFGVMTIPVCPSMKGFLITYNSQFTFCVNEAKKILEQFVVKVCFIKKYHTKD